MQNRIKKLSIVSGVFCFLLAILFLSYAIYFGFDGVRFFINQDFINSVGNILVLFFGLLFIPMFGIILICISIVSISFCISYLSSGIKQIRLGVQDLLLNTKNRWIKGVFVLDILLIILFGYRFIIGLGRLIVHGINTDLITFIVFGAIPFVLIVLNIIFNRLLAKEIKLKSH